jgi:C4-dicarboxylate-specific signal transduction histidine kinase
MDAKLSRSSVPIARTQARGIVEPSKEITGAIPHLVWSALPNGKINYRNAQSYELLGIEPGSKQDHALESAMHPDDIAVVLAAWRKSLVSGEMFEQQYRRILKGTSEPRWYLARAVPVRGPSGAICHWVGTSTDVDQMHKQIHAAPANQPTQAELSHLARVNTMGQLATGLAHELNQPLGAILNYAGICSDLLTQEKTNDAQRTLTQGLSEIARESQRASAIIRRLRRLIRKGDPHRESMDLNQQMQEMASLMTFDLRQQQVQVKYMLDDAIPAVWADPIEIQQVMVNLMQNAMDAMSEHTGPREIVIQTGIHHHRALVRVADNGSGIPTEKIQAIFDPFFTTKSTGLGMGLSICKSIIQNHGGELTVESRPGKTVFSFTLPFELEGQRHAAAKFN